MINYGIDLGTTNSLISKFNAGKVEVFKNPRGHKEGLPSVVGFRQDKILVGDKAREYSNKDPKNVISRFKRKMGTTETYRIDTINSSKSPEELSSLVLKELKGFIHSGETIDSAVITIPASFDTIQSNATKEAGNLAGFDNVILLQEPIAASLSYANKDNSNELKNSQWIVYDLGGGTFDVALVKIIEGELTIVDHEGDNFFGGTDLDALIVEHIVVPQLESKGTFANLLNEMKSSTGRYEKEWYRFLNAAEDAKIELSSDKSTEIEYVLDDDNGNEVEGIITFTRSDFEKLIKDKVTETTQMLKKILTRQSIQPQDLKFVLMVGGSTFIPFIRQHVEEVMGIPINTDIDPTNAITVGAAFFAGSKKKETVTKKTIDNKSNIKVRAIYERNSQDSEEMFSAKIEGDIAGMTYRIISADGAFDSGSKELKTRIHEDLPLREGEYNLFEFNILNSLGNQVQHAQEQVQIAQGKYSVAGQMLPEDLCLVKDDLILKDTKLDCIFEQNAVLPSRASQTVEAGKTVLKDSEQDVIRVMVVEGSSDNHYLSNKPIGTLEISGANIKRDLLKGTEIDLTFELSESRDLTISAYLNGTGQEFSQVFNPKKREVSPQTLGTEIIMLEEMIHKEQEEAAENKNYNMEENLGKSLKDVQTLMLDAGEIPEDSVTDEKFQLEDKKRKLAQQVHQLTSSKRVDAAKQDYQELKGSVSKLIQENGNDHEKHQVRQVIGREQVFLMSNNPNTIEAATDELGSIQYKILMRMPNYLVHMFELLVESRVSMNDQIQAKNLIENGIHLIESESWDDLRIVIGRLWDLVPEKEREADGYRLFTGIV